MPRRPGPRGWPIGSAPIRGRLEAIGGVPRLIVPDNTKTAVIKACLYEPSVNRTYAEMAAHYDTAILPTRPRRPRDKAKVEAGVLIMERWIIGRLRNRRFHGLAELNAAIREDPERVEEHQRIDRLQRPGLPGGDLVEHRIRHRADQGGRHVDAIQVAQMPNDLPRAHAARVHGDDLVIGAGKPALVLGDEQRPPNCDGLAVMIPLA